MYPEDYRYTKEHEWVKKEGTLAVVGITSFAQHELGDIVYVELPAPGKKYNAGEAFGTVESVKAVSEIYAPMAMEVVEANNKVIEQPELVNQDAHESGWLVKVKILNESDYDKLMDASQYAAVAAEEKH
jgi:glycine cleavage system H protein